MKVSDIIIIDVDASGLSEESFPIEIGWISLDKKKHDTFLIKPDIGWEFWDDASENIHGLSRSVLEFGLDTHLAVSRLETALSGKNVYSDADSWDNFWVDRLYETVDLQRTWFILNVCDLARTYDFSENYTYSGHRALSDADRIVTQLRKIYFK